MWVVEIKTLLANKVSIRAYKNVMLSFSEKKSIILGQNFHYFARTGTDLTMRSPQEFMGSKNPDFR